MVTMVIVNLFSPKNQQKQKLAERFRETFRVELADKSASIDYIFMSVLESWALDMPICDLSQEVDRSLLV